MLRISVPPSGALALALLMSACGGTAAPVSSTSTSSVAPSTPAAAASQSAAAKPAGSAQASAAPAAFKAYDPNAPGDKMIVSHSQLSSTPNEAALAGG